MSGLTAFSRGIVDALCCGNLHGPYSFYGSHWHYSLKREGVSPCNLFGSKGGKIRDSQVIVRQGAFTLTATLLEKTVSPLRATQNGAMTRIIRENAACHAWYHLSDNRKTILEFETAAASFEYDTNSH